MSPPRHRSGWIAALVVTGLLAMHGAAGNHGSTAMAASASVAMSQTSPASGVNAPMPATAQPPLTVDADGMYAHAMTLCIALPAGFALIILAVAYLGRRRHQAASHRWARPVRDARAPPCPPPHVRGVCLT